VLSIRDLVSGRSFESREPFRVGPRPAVTTSAEAQPPARTD
jgi:hypothetical protein